MKRKIYILLLLLPLLAGCYRDKGNYDYTQLNPIEITGIDEQIYYYVYLGEPFTMPEPEIAFKDPAKAHDDLSYRWRIDGRVVSTEKRLNVDVALEPTFSYYVGDFTVTDEHTGISYLKKFRVQVSSNFAQGWMWLAEDGGRASLNMMTSTSKFFGDLVTSVNETELGPEAYQIVEHFSQVGYNWYSGVLAVAGAGSIELDWSSLRREAWMREEFTGAQMPAGLKPVAAAFTKNYSCVVGDNGRVYIRYSQGGYLYEGRYPSVPFYADFDISPVVAWALPPAYNAVLMFDRKSCSYVYLDGDGALQRLDRAEDQGGVFAVGDMDKDLVYLATVGQSGNNSLFYAVVRDRVDGKYLAQQFEFGVSGREAYLKTLSQSEFPDAVDESTRFAVGYKTPDVWYSRGSVLCRYNRELGDAPVEVRDFGTGPIEAIALNVYADQYGVTVADGDGYDFYWETTAGDRLAEQKGLRGEVKDLIYKVGYAFYYE